MNSENNDNIRPWGFYENLIDDKTHKVKRITVYPEKRLSLQSHEKRAEHWFIVQGDAIVTLNDTERQLISGDSINIGIKDIHRIQNVGKENVIFIEVQTGEYFGEDDIVRYEDDFGRC